MAHPRSGTGYLARLFRAFGMDVAHEVKMGNDGISSWLFGGCENPRWGPDPWKYEFENRIHLTRYPLVVVSSMLQVVPDGVQEYMARECGIDPEMSKVRRIVEVYLEWHTRILTRKPNIRMKVEDAPEAIASWLDRKPNPDLLPTPDVNNRQAQLRGCITMNLTWTELRMNVPVTTMLEFEALTEEYGYPVKGKDD